MSPRTIRGIRMDGEERLLTYAEAAELLGVKIDSVKRRARNRRWRRERANDGLVRIGVPVSILPPDDPPDSSTEFPSDDPGDIRRLEKLVSELETEVRMLREAQEDLRGDRDAWRDLARRRWWHGLIRRPRRSP